MPTEAKCVKLLRELRWGKGPVTCPFCKSDKVVSNGTYNKHSHKFYCRPCNRAFNERTGTLFDCSKLQLREWFYIARELQRNTSMNQIHKDTGIAYQHVMHACHTIMNNVFMKRLIELSGQT